MNIHYAIEDVKWYNLEYQEKEDQGRLSGRDVHWKKHQQEVGTTHKFDF